MLRAILVIESGFSLHSFDNWRIATSATIAAQVFVRLVMTAGPHWNSHALTANVATLRVAPGVRVDHRPERAATIWSVPGNTLSDFRDRLAAERD